jgi:hypothetical protein
MIAGKLFRLISQANQCGAVKNQGLYPQVLANFWGGNEKT